MIDIVQGYPHGDEDGKEVEDIRQEHFQIGKVARRKKLAEHGEQLRLQKFHAARADALVAPERYLEGGGHILVRHGVLDKVPLSALEHAVEVELRVLRDGLAVIAAAFLEHLHAHHRAGAVDVRRNAQPLAHAAAEAGIEGIEERARLGVEVQRALVGAPELHAALIGVVHERGKFTIDVVVRVDAQDKVVRLLPFQPDDMVDAVLHGIERHAVRGVGIVQDKHLCARLFGKLRRLVRAVVRDNKDVKFLAGIVLFFEQALHRGIDDVLLVMRGDEIGDAPLLIALWPRLFFDEGKEHIEYLQKQRDGDDDEYDIIDDAQYAEQDFMPHKHSSTRVARTRPIISDFTRAVNPFTTNLCKRRPDRWRALPPASAHTPIF